ncbi:hypothetical protein SAMN05216480_10316 [Pustulibacterium marinum]|uniref:Uncharacterized protein n=1 Tax=Pustulibacterium marinum TaxID=1224947 RepID=A0A1I7G048_9FLAO|nr:hypothetical protein [Pustulibacterium marinum]SFU41829.1 hypothetical protein SAMN05216480_10316 [Pustulibacterium marinum]
MMKKSIGLWLLLCLPFLSIAQETNVPTLAAELCNDFKDVDTTQSIATLSNILQQKAVAFYNRHETDLAAMEKQTKQVYVEKSDLEVYEMVRNFITAEAITSCPVFMKVYQKVAKRGYATDKLSIQHVSQKVCDLMAANASKGYVALNELVNNSIYDFEMEEKRLIEKEYGQFGSREYFGDLQAYMMYNCDEFFKMAIYIEMYGTEAPPKIEKEEFTAAQKEIGYTQDEFNDILGKVKTLVSDIIYADYDALTKKLNIPTSTLKTKLDTYLNGSTIDLKDSSDRTFISESFTKGKAKKQLELTIIAMTFLDKRAHEEFTRGDYHFVIQAQVGLSSEEELILTDVVIITEDKALDDWWLGQYKDYVSKTIALANIYELVPVPPPYPPTDHLK